LLNLEQVIFINLEGSMVQMKRKAIEEVIFPESDANQATLQLKYSNKILKSIPLAAIQFDDLPDTGYVREPVVLVLFGCSKTTLWRWVKKSRIPAPVKFSKRFSAWQVGELRSCMQGLQSESLKCSKNRVSE
jgi:prophage regulatory protein